MDDFISEQNNQIDPNDIDNVLKDTDEMMGRIKNLLQGQ